MSRRSMFETPIPQLLCTNDEPSTQQIVSIHRIIQDAVDNVQTETLDNEEARRRHAAIASFIHIHNALLSPIRQVPAEIWEQIFHHVAYSKDSESLEATRRIGQVCRLWNSATKSLPELLAILPPVRLTPQTAKPSFVRSLEQIISTIPDTYPLSIRVLDPARQDVHPVVRFLYTHAKRWEYLSISIDRAAIRSLSLSFYKKFSNLRRLQIYVPSTQNFDYAGHVDAFSISGAPMLTELEVDSLAPIHLILPWSKLKRYKERSSGREIGLARVLKDGANIEHLEYRTGYPATIVDIRTSDRPTLTGLKSIDIRLYHNSTLAFPLLDQFTAPHLEVIKIKDHGKDFLPFLLDFIDRCCCRSTLTSLTFDTSVMNPGDLTKILLCTPALTKLECNDIPFVDLCVFSVRKGTTSLVPLLHDLVIHSPSLSQQDLDALAKSRSRTSEDHLDQPFSLKLVFSYHKHCQEAMEILLGSEYSSGVTRSRLYDTLAELDIQVDEMKAKVRGNENSQFRALWRSIYAGQNPGKKINELIIYLEKVPLEKMPESIHWAIHILERFRVLDPANVPQNSKYNFLNRADSLVYAWRDFRRRQKSTYDWILHGRFSVMYVGGMRAQGSAGESEAQNWWECTHEKYKIGEDRDVLWAHYDFSENALISDYLSWRRDVNFN